MDYDDLFVYSNKKILPPPKKKLLLVVVVVHYPTFAHSATVFQWTIIGASENRWYSLGQNISI